MKNAALFLAASLSAAVPATLNGAPPPLPEGTVVRTDVAYVDDAHPRQKLDLYVPKHPPGQKLPVLLWVHGGAWLGGSKDHAPLEFLPHGYAVVSVGYRLSHHAVFPAQIQDCQAAVRWVRAHAAGLDLDPDRIAAWGASAGGHLVALLGTAADEKSFAIGPHAAVSARVTCVVDYFGPTDLARMEEQDSPEFGTMDHLAPDCPESKLLGGPILENKAKADKASPIFYVTKDDSPMLLVHGDRDPLVPHRQSVTFAEALRKAGVPVTLHTAPGAGHGNGFGPREHKAVEEFLARHLKDRKED